MFGWWYGRGHFQTLHQASRGRRSGGCCGRAMTSTAPRRGWSQQPPSGSSCVGCCHIQNPIVKFKSPQKRKISGRFGKNTLRFNTCHNPLHKRPLVWKCMALQLLSPRHNQKGQRSHPSELIQPDIQKAMSSFICQALDPVVAEGQPTRDHQTLLVVFTAVAVSATTQQESQALVQEHHVP